jgi:predicted adenine nucleotide alpha hydrolase (AANH) superfamily ATPase
MLKDMGYSVTVYFYNPNIYPDSEYQKRLEAEETLCKHFGVELIVGEYNTDEFYKCAKGLESEPEKGLRCDECFKLRLRKTAKLAKQMNIHNFTTSIVISPHKNFEKLTKIGTSIASEFELNYLAIDFKKKDGFLKTNKLSKELNLYRQNYCGCKFSLR